MDAQGTQKNIIIIGMSIAGHSEFVLSTSDFLIRGMADKKYYVTMTDKFMSGWGTARGKTNKVVVECDTYDEALIVAENCEHRSDMKYVNVCSSKPSYNSSRYHVSFKTKADYPNWFRKGAF